MDSLLESTGAYGRFQIAMILLTGSISSLVSITTYASVFVTGDSKLICSDHENPEKKFSDDEKCLIWLNQTRNTLNHTRYECKFDKSLYGDTIITDFNLVCDRQYLASITQTILILGSILSFFVGSIGDYYGRRKTTIAFLSTICATITSFQFLVSIKTFSLDTRYVLYTVGQFLLGFQTSCCYSIAYTLLLEVTTSEHRTRITSKFSYAFVIGELIVMLAYYFTQNWMSLQWFMSVYSCCVLILVFTFLSESPQWLISVKRYDDAKKLLIEIGRINKTRLYMGVCNIEDDELKNLMHSNTVTPESLPTEANSSSGNKFFKLFYPISVLLKTLLLIYTWNALNMIYYGISFGVTSLGVVNPYLMFFLSSVAEAIGAYIYQSSEPYGRRKTLLLFLITCVVSCSTVAIIQHNAEQSSSSTITTIMIIFVLFGKTVSTSAFNLIYMYTSELYETSIRNTAVQFLACFGGIGSFVAPQINYLSVSVWQPLPFIIFSSAALFACVCVKYLKETRSNTSSSLFRFSLNGATLTI